MPAMARRASSKVFFLKALVEKASWMFAMAAILSIRSGRGTSGGRRRVVVLGQPDEVFEADVPFVGEVARSPAGGLVFLGGLERTDPWQVITGQQTHHISANPCR